ncbi:vWA domain-containing protein [Halofilum ochraceum]|uniref:vWA domain-containing protein n=1 Tax=Halofilum ochraceum TaxID=1611323 RepID=UPI00083120A0|nr:VWA domain-containing protein [Halofilum ochraceum]
MSPAPVTRGLLDFTRTLRARGWPVGIDEQHDALRLAAEVSVADRERLRDALRALYCGTGAQWSEFDTVFDDYWYPKRGTRTRASGAGSGLQPQPGTGMGENFSPPDKPGHGSGAEADPGGAHEGASASESLARRDFRHLHDPEERRTLDAMLERMARHWRHRLRRRWRALQKGRRLDLRRTLRRSLPRGGVPIDPVWRKPRQRPPNLILLVDASRSMSLYSYRFLRFAAGALAAFPGSEAFVFHTRLVRVTDALQEPSAERVREKLALLSSGFEGGTRIGDSLTTFNHQYGQTVRRRTVVVILSDGLDTGDTATLIDALGELRRRSGRIIWLNPLMGRRGYAPEAKAMKAALPFIDRLAPAHNLDSLLALETDLVRV